MSLLNLISFVGLILGIGAALDFALKKEKKTVISSALFNRDLNVEVKYGASNLLSRLFGNRIFSTRAVFVSIGLSLISLLASYIYAYLTSDFSLVAIFDTQPETVSIIIFCLFVMGCVVGDTVSYGQTRIFLRTVDRNQKATVSVGLAMADAVISLAIFVSIFSVVRMIIYVILINAFSGNTIHREERIVPPLVEYTLKELQQDNLVRNDEIAWSIYVASVSSDEDASLLDEILRQYIDTSIPELPNDAEIESKISFSCKPDPTDLFMAQRDSTMLISREIAAARGIPSYSVEYTNIADDVAERTSLWKPEPVKCGVPILKIDQTITAGSLLKISSFANGVWASFERTLFNFYENFGFKLSTYSSVDPYDDIDDFYFSLIAQTRVGFLGLSPGNPTASYILSDFEANDFPIEDRLRIPFSPMLASCLTVSVLFWIYIIFIMILNVTKPIPKYLSNSVVNFDITNAPFTTIGVVSIAALLAFNIIMFIVSILWNLAT